MKKHLLSLLALFLVAVTSANADPKLYKIDVSDVFLSSGQSEQFDAVTLSCLNGILMPLCWDGECKVTSVSGNQIIYLHIGSTYKVVLDDDTWYWWDDWGAECTSQTDTVESGHLRLYDVYRMDVIVDE